MSEEKCVRCGSVEEDLRTLKMACFYAMEELDLPFKKSILFHAEGNTFRQVEEPASIQAGGRKINITPGVLATDGPIIPEDFYTLRVCKSCRGSWMETIQNWFRTVPEEELEDRNATIPIRKLGALKYISPEEWYATRGNS